MHSMAIKILRFYLYYRVSSVNLLVLHTIRKTFGVCFNTTFKEKKNSRIYNLVELETFFEKIFNHLISNLITKRAICQINTLKKPICL